MKRNIQLFLMQTFCISLITLFALVQTAQAQNFGVIQGKVHSKSKPVDGASIKLENAPNSTLSDENGEFILNQIIPGDYFIEVTAIGFQSNRVKVSVIPNQTQSLEIELNEDYLNMNEVVVSATRYGVDRKKAAVIVNVLSPKIFNATQSVAMSETLNFQPGVRVETNCQNCGFSQVRLNGLEGAYSQILINSRGVFSALNSVYGLDQIPTSMVDRIEVVRSGGSALFGANAIAGTINIITKDPVENTWQIGNTNNLIDGTSWDHTLDFNASIVSDDLMNGVTFYGMNRNRDYYDANGDGYTEMTKLNNTTFGSKAFYRPNEFQKFTLDLSVINEFRRGGGQVDLAPHLTDITEQLTHKTWIAGINYDINSKDYTSKYSAYFSAQKTNRESFYGGLAGGRTAIDSLMANNSYGDTDDFALVAGVQYTKNFESDVFTAGIEQQMNSTEDEIRGYNRLVDQQTSNTGIYAQYEWKPISDFTTLLGVRYDRIKVDGKYTLQNINRESDNSTYSISPRLTVLYNIIPELQFRGGYARGFRAPQAFNEDMHVSSAGGQQVFVLMGENLKVENSNAYTASLNYTDQWGSTQTSLLLEGFYTELVNPFTTVRTQQLDQVILDEMRNGLGAVVRGMNAEWSLAPSSRYSLQAGATWQTAFYKDPQTIIEADEENNLEAIDVKKFVRAPNVYGFINSNLKITDDFAFDVTGVYTGSMIVPHQVNRELVKVPDFMEVNFRLGYTVHVNDHYRIEFNGGIQNVFNSFQKDFGVGYERDNDYVYGPSRPRTFFFGVKIGHFH